MSTATLPPSLPEAHALIGQQRGEIQQLQWRVGQLEKQLFGPTSDRAFVTETLSKEQVLLSLFPPPAEPPATAEVSVPGLPSSVEDLSPRRPARTPTPARAGDGDRTPRAGGKTLPALWEGQVRDRL